jgi:GNAT superfamily N-acetyltransferase
MDLDIAPVGDRMELWKQLSGFWPAFVTNDPSSSLYYDNFPALWPRFALLAVDRETGRAVAKAHAVPLSFTGDIRAGLPENGWDWAIRSAALDHLGGVEPTIVSALEIMVRPDLRGGGLSGRMLAAMRENAARSGFKDLVAPVRPSGKHSQIDRPIDEYAYDTRADGLPVDPWLRVHVRAGGTILNVAHSGGSGPGCRSTGPGRWWCPRR